MKCPFAKWVPVKYNGGAYTSGPFRIVLHTTEGSSAAGALAIFAQEYAAHFVIDEKTVYQLLDTGVAGCAMRNSPQWPETNRLSAIQIEMVGFAGQAKSKATLRNTKAVCRWIEKVHGVQRQWPNGFCVPAVNGHDPGQHNRNALVWSQHGGYYGHEHVPENIHWDPALTKSETDFLMK